MFSGNNLAQVRGVAERVGEDLTRFAAGVEVLGPSPCALARLRGKSRYQILLKSTERGPLRQLLLRFAEKLNQLPKQVALAIDVDPVDML